MATKSLNIKTGLQCFKPYAHTDDVIYFNPGDPNIAVRLKKASETISEKLRALKEGDTVETLEEINDIFCSELDKVFGFGVSAVLFKDFHPLAFDGEHYLVESILTAIADVIRAESKQKIKKHTAKYARS